MRRGAQSRPCSVTGWLRETISRTRGGGGGLWRSLECPSAAGPPPCQRAVRSRPWCPRLAPRSGLPIVQWCRDQGAVRGPAWQAGVRGRGLPHRSGQLPQEAPPARPQPLSGCSLAGRPRVQSLSEPTAPPLPTQVPVCAGVGCEITVRTPESMHVCFCFSGKKEKVLFLFFIFLLFFFWLFKIFLFLQTLDLAHGEPSKRDSAS